MPVPKRRKSASKSKMQRSANMKYKVTKFVVCDNCEKCKLAHHICPECGYYAKIQILKYKDSVDDENKTES